MFPIFGVLKSYFYVFLNSGFTLRKAKSMLSEICKASAQTSKGSRWERAVKGSRQPVHDYKGHLNDFIIFITVIPIIT